MIAPTDEQLAILQPILNAAAIETWKRVPGRTGINPNQINISGSLTCTPDFANISRGKFINVDTPDVSNIFAQELNAALQKPESKAAFLNLISSLGIMDPQLVYPFMSKIIFLMADNLTSASLASIINTDIVYGPSGEITIRKEIKGDLCNDTINLQAKMTADSILMRVGAALRSDPLLQRQAVRETSTTIWIWVVVIIVALIIIAIVAFVLYRQRYNSTVALKGTAIQV